MLIFKKQFDKMTPNLRRVGRDMKQVREDAYKFFVKTTPIDTGNARRKTRLAGDTIRADYPYAKVLDKGRSKQAPRGMTRPTIDFLKAMYNKVIRKR
jgi:hypothetical protein